MSNSEQVKQPKDKMASEKKYETLDLTGPLTPSSMSSSVCYPYVTEDIPNEEAYQNLIMLMFRFPNRDIYLYQERNGARNRIILEAEKRGDIEFGVTEFFHYKYPNSRKDFMHLEVRDGNYEYEWQKEIAEKSPMYIRTILHLSVNKRLEIESWHKVQMEEVFRRKFAEAASIYDVFISYSSVDSTEAHRLYEAVKERGGKPFLAAKDINPGDYFADKIRDALTGSKELWLLVSPTSLRSDWVLSEWGAAWALKKTIIPILHRCAATDLPDRLRGLHCIDFYRYQELIDKKTWGSSSSKKDHQL